MEMNKGGLTPETGKRSFASNANNRATLHLTAQKKERRHPQLRGQILKIIKTSKETLVAIRWHITHKY